MKYLLQLITLSMMLIKYGNTQRSVNSLLTSQALHTHPFSNPVVPLSPNGVSAAHAAAETLHIDEILHHQEHLHHGHPPPPPPLPIDPLLPDPLHPPLHHLAEPLHHAPEPLHHHHESIHPIVHEPHLHVPLVHKPIVHDSYNHPPPVVHDSYHHPAPAPLKVHKVHHHHSSYHEPLVHHHHEPHYEVHHEVAHLKHHPPHHEVLHHKPHHNLHHKVAVEHLVIPPHDDHPPLLHPPSLAGHAPLGACTPLCSVLDLVVFHPEFTTLVSLLRAAGLVDLLSQPGPITLFAPTNAAFDAISPATFKALLSDRVALQSVLLRHVTRGALHSADFPPGPTPLVTGAGERVTVTAFPNQVTLTSVLAVSHIIDVDNEASNGVVHVVDSVF